MDSFAENLKEQQKVNDQLLVASQAGLLEELKILIERGADINAVDAQKLSAVHLASTHGHPQIVQYLWSKSADIDAENSVGQTPLHFAACNGHHSTAQFLLSKGAISGAEDGAQSTPMHYAARHGHTAIIKSLLEYQAPLQGTDVTGITPLGYAVLKGNLDIADILSKNSAKIDASTPFGFSMLHIVAGFADAKSIEWMFQNGGDDVHRLVNDTSNSDHYTPLHCAVRHSRLDNIHALLQHGAQCDITDIHGQTPLQVLLAAETNDKNSKKRNQHSTAADVIKEIEMVLRKHEMNAKASNKRKAGGNTSSSTKAAAMPKNSDDQITAQQFRELGNQEQTELIEKWSLLSITAPETLQNKILKNFNGAANITHHLEKIAQLNMRINAHKALSALRGDEDFQSYMWVPKVESAVRELTKNPALHERYADDHRITFVLQRMKSVHAALKSNRQTMFALSDVIVSRHFFEAQKREDAKALEAMIAEKGVLVTAAIVAASVPAHVANVAVEGVYRTKAMSSSGVNSGTDSDTDTNGTEVLSFPKGDGIVAGAEECGDIKVRRKGALWAMHVFKRISIVGGVVLVVMFAMILLHTIYINRIDDATHIFKKNIEL